jgi:hypothetical protein
MEAQDRFQLSQHGICGVKSYIGTFFLRLLRFFNVSIISPVLHTHYFVYHWSYIISPTDRLLK